MIALNLFKKHRDARLAKMRAEIKAFERSSQKMIEALEGLASANEKLQATISILEERGVLEKRDGDK
jgi:hypothetical protein